MLLQGQINLRLCGDVDFSAGGLVCTSLMIIGCRQASPNVDLNYTPNVAMFIRRTQSKCSPCSLGIIFAAFSRCSSASPSRLTVLPSLAAAFCSANDWILMTSSSLLPEPNSASTSTSSEAKQFHACSTSTAKEANGNHRRDRRQPSPISFSLFDLCHHTRTQLLGLPLGQSDFVALRPIRQRVLNCEGPVEIHLDRLVMKLMIERLFFFLRR